MPLFGRNSRIPPEIREKLQLATAVATENVLAEHLRSALELLDEGADSAPVDRLLAAYARLHHLSQDEHRQLRERVLVALGKDPHAAERHAQIEPHRSLIRRARHRLRGRVNLELREWMEGHTARTALAVFEVHVRHAMRFVEIMDEHGSTDDALDAYTEAMRLRFTTAEFIRLRVFATLHKDDEPLAEVEPLRSRPISLPLRIAEDGG